MQKYFTSSTANHRVHAAAYPQPQGGCRCLPPATVFMKCGVPKAFTSATVFNKCGGKFHNSEISRKQQEHVEEALDWYAGRSKQVLLCLIECRGSAGLVCR